MLMFYLVVRAGAMKQRREEDNHRRHGNIRQNIRAWAAKAIEGNASQGHRYFKGLAVS